jgi:hypothetical protein
MNSFIHIAADSYMNRDKKSLTCVHYVLSRT